MATVRGRQDMTGSTNFEVIVSGSGSSIEEWKRAQRAAPSELPELNDAQKEVARKFGISDEEYARSYLSLRYGAERTRDRATALGVAVEQILESLNGGYRLLAVVAEMAKLRWVVRVQALDRTVNIAIERGLGDDVVDSNTVQDKQRLKAVLLSSLGLGEPTAKH